MNKKLIKVPKAIQHIVKSHIAYRHNWLEKNNEIYLEVKNKEIGTIENHFIRIARDLYLRGISNNCLFCNSLDIEGSSVEIGEHAATQEIVCLSCGKEWQDIYTLTDIQVYN